MNLRVIKKDIEFLVGDFVEDCLMFAAFHPEKDAAEVEKLINGANELANNLFEKVNHPAKDANKRAWYKNVGKELIEGLDDLCKKLSDLAK